MDSDHANFEPTIPGTALLDLRVGGEIDKFFGRSRCRTCSLLYFDYAIASAFTFGTIQRLSAAGPHVPGEGRDAVLK